MDVYSESIFNYESSFYKDKNVLVTGGTGFVGTHLVKYLLASGAKVRVPIHDRNLVEADLDVELVSANLIDAEECLKATKNMDYVFHAAGAVSAAGVTATNPMSAITTNLILTARVLEASWRNGVECCQIFGSSTGYPPSDHPIKEEEMWSGDTYPGYFGYGWMRRYLEKLSEFVAQKSDTRIALVRPTATYGRYDNFDLKTSHVIPALIRKAVERHSPYEVWGSGNEVRDFLHVNDLARGCLLVLEKKSGCDPVNLGYGEAVTVKEIISHILSAAGHQNAEIFFNSDRPGTIPFRMVDTSKATHELNFSPAVSLEEGLADTVTWFRNTLC